MTILVLLICEAPVYKRSGRFLIDWGQCLQSDVKLTLHRVAKALSERMWYVSKLHQVDSP